MIDYRNLSEIIFFNRRKKKISQTELAKSANVSRNYISAIERGNIKNVSIGVFFSICMALDLVVEVHKENNVPVLVRCNCGNLADRDGVQCDNCFIRENTRPTQLAPDKWESPDPTGIVLPLSWDTSQSESTPPTCG